MKALLEAEPALGTAAFGTAPCHHGKMPKITAPTIAAHRARTRGRIMDAVEELILSQGADRTSMTAVAAHAGITRTALYNYFPDKHALILAVTERINTTFVEHYLRELPSGVSCARKLSAFVRLQLEGLLTHPHLPVVDPEALPSPGTHQQLAAPAAPIRRLLTGILEEGVATGEFDPLPARATAGLTLSMIEGLRKRLLHEEIDVDGVHALITRFTLRGLGVPAETIGTILPQPLTESHR